MLDDIIVQYPDIDVGGSGYDLHKALPEEIENMRPDYSNRSAISGISDK